MAKIKAIYDNGGLSINRYRVILDTVIGEGPGWTKYRSFHIGKDCDKEGAIVTFDETILPPGMNRFDTFWSNLSKSKMAWLPKNVQGHIKTIAEGNIARNWRMHVDQFGTWSRPNRDFWIRVIKRRK
jgi:hypothetical protein